MLSKKVDEASLKSLGLEAFLTSKITNIITYLQRYEYDENHINLNGGDYLTK